MAVRLRMKRMGTHKRPFYRIVAADSRYQRDGRFLETLGYYDPKKDPFILEVNRDKILAWLNKGAQMSDTVQGLLRREGIVQEYNKSKRVTAESPKSEETKESSVTLDEERSVDRKGEKNAEE